jgi:hypothetical protein
MKKFISTLLSAIGIIAVVAIAVLILRYGAINMRQVNEEAYTWRLTWVSRR